jgi:hypothetical protein
MTDEGLPKELPLAEAETPPFAASPWPPLLKLLLLGIPALLLLLGHWAKQPALGWGAVLTWLGLASWWGRPLWVQIGRDLWQWLTTWPTLGWAVAALGLAGVGGLAGSGVFSTLRSLSWEAIGALGEVFGATGQILIALLAAYIAWRQYVISRDLTIQQNIITQQQTIDAYFEGISNLVLSPDGQLDDWPLERAIAAGRTAAILNGVDRFGKAKILRFLSTANLLSPLRRDEHLGRPILDGKGGYQRDRVNGIRVVKKELTCGIAILATPTSAGPTCAMLTSVGPIFTALCCLWDPSRRLPLSSRGKSPISKRELTPAPSWRGQTFAGCVAFPPNRELT